MSTRAAYRALVADDFSPKQARSLLWTIWKTDHLPHRTYELDFEASDKKGELVLKNRTWWWRGRILHRKAL